jgi:hypothetical protein
MSILFDEFCEMKQMPLLIQSERFENDGMS